MKAIRILEAGPLATIQDQGRYGFQDRGIPVSGAMDRQALRLANLLVGNPATDACVEVTLGGFKAEFLCATFFALAGADQGARLNREPMPNWMSHRARPGDVLTLDIRPSGCRAYLALGGGVDVAPVMGSRSTCLAGGFGGYQGRALRSGDILHRGEVEGTPIRVIPTRLIPPYRDDPVLRVVLGPQEESFTAAGLAAFLTGRYEVTSRADRMGIALSGPEIAHRDSADILSDGVVAGAIQVPGNRQPIILMADSQTAGGYAKIGTVASFDLPLAAQLRPGCRVRFKAISVLQAREIHLRGEYFYRNLLKSTVRL